MGIEEKTSTEVWIERALSTVIVTLFLSLPPPSIPYIHRGQISEQQRTMYPEGSYCLMHYGQIADEVKPQISIYSKKNLVK